MTQLKQLGQRRLTSYYRARHKTSLEGLIYLLSKKLVSEEVYSSNVKFITKKLNDNLRGIK